MSMSCFLSRYLKLTVLLIANYFKIITLKLKNYNYILYFEDNLFLKQRTILILFQRSRYFLNSSSQWELLWGKQMWVSAHLVKSPLYCVSQVANWFLAWDSWLIWNAVMNMFLINRLMLMVKFWSNLTSTEKTHHIVLRRAMNWEVSQTTASYSCWTPVLTNQINHQSHKYHLLITDSFPLGWIVKMSVIVGCSNFLQN